MRKYLSFLLMFVILLFQLYRECRTDLATCHSMSQKKEAALIFKREVNAFQTAATKQIRKFFPSPHSELLLGMLLGIDDLKLIPTFNDVLKDTGTVHIVVVSGYNISLVFDLVIRLIGTKYKLRNLIAAQFVTLVYSVITGFEPPVIRAWIMGSIASWGKFYGRSIQALQVLVFSGLVMGIVNPHYLYSLSFQLSFLATLSLILYTNPISAFTKNFIKNDSFILTDLSTTLAAQVLVWPLISYRFGRISLLSPLVNCLVLWNVPLATVLGGAFLFLSFIHALPAQILFFVVYPPLEIFVEVVRFFAQFKVFILNFQLDVRWLLAYYIALFIFPLFKSLKTAYAH